MPRKKKTDEQNGVKGTPINENAHILGAGEVQNQFITDTLEENYMPYAMSVIMYRAIPEIDGFKPSHRKLLYTMYQMGLLKGGRSKSANIVGATMKLNPHGDMAIYETMVRLTRGNETLLHPYVDSKGNFGKAYSKNMQFAASRYTEAKLDPICAELFADIDKDDLFTKEHLGLTNVRYSMNLIYHRDDLLRLSNKEEGGARIELLIPEGENEDETADL